MSELYEEAKRALQTAARQEAGWRWVALAVVVAAIGLFHHLIGFKLVGAHADFWRKYVGLHGAVIGIDRFGESAPAGQLFDLFGFTVANVVSTTKALLS
mgnify:CR=1 FL=1